MTKGRVANKNTAPVTALTSSEQTLPETGRRSQIAKPSAATGIAASTRVAAGRRRSSGGASSWGKSTMIFASEGRQAKTLLAEVVSWFKR